MRTGGSFTDAMRVLHVIDSLGRGGAERVVVNLALAMKARTTVCVAPLFDYGPLEDELREAGIRLEPLRVGHRRDLLTGAMRLGRLIAGFRPDVVHTHLLFSELYAALSLIPAGAVRLATFHNLGFDALPNVSLRQRLVRAVERQALLRRFDGYVAVSQRAAQSARRHLGLDSVEVIHNPVDVGRVRELAPATQPVARAQLGVAADERLVVLVGKLSEPKGHDVALQAFAGLPANLGVRLAFVGAGPLARELRELSLSLAVDPRVRWVGEADAAGALAWLQAADVVMLPSRHEGLPITLLEAMALGKPVVATTVGGIPEVVEHQRTAWLIPPSAPDALAAALTHLLENPTLAAALGEAAREDVARRFSVGEAARRYLDLYERLRIGA